MKIKILGNSGAFPHNNPCSGYLIEGKKDKILIECGSGVVLKLKEHCSVDQLSGIIISHLHWDHLSDLMPLRYEVDYLQAEGRIKNPLALYCPDEPREIYELLPYKNTLNIIAIDSDNTITLNELQIKFFEVKHPVKCFGINVFEQGEKKVCYSSDTEYFLTILNEAKGAHLFICESTALKKDEPQLTGHLSGPQAANIAKQAGVSCLGLTHFWPYYDSKKILEEARESCPDLKIVLLNPGDEITI